MQIFLELTTGELINTHWLNNVYVEDTNCIFELVNGAKYTEKYDSADEAQNRCDEVHTKLTT